MASRNDTPFLQLDLPFGPHEAWKPIPGYEGLYEVSNLGRVRSLDRVEYYVRGGRKRKGRLLKLFLSHGYKRVVLSVDGKQRKVMVHNLVLSAFVGPRPASFQTNHIDGNKTNNVLENLEWVTARENIMHAVATGLKDTAGEQHPMAKLTDQQVIEIRAMDALGARRRDLALLFGVKYITIYDIVTRRHWRHLP